MSVSEMLQDRIAERQTALRSKGWNSLLDHVREFAQKYDRESIRKSVRDGVKQPEIDKIILCLASVGKEAVDFDAYLELMWKRIPSFDILTLRDGLQIDAPKLYAEWKRIAAEAKESAKAYAEKERQAFHASNAATGGIREANEAEKFLIDTCLDFSLHARKIALQDRWGKTHAALQIAEKERNSQRSIVDSAKRERERLVLAHSHPDNLEVFDSQMVYAKKLLEDFQAAFEIVFDEMKALNEELEDINAQMITP